MMRGKLLVIEGIDGSGKATQSDALFKKIEGTGQPVKLVSFPDYDHPSSTLVKLYLGGQVGAGGVGDVNAYAASTFYAADRYISFKNRWEQDYEDGLVIADRYTTSNLIHQMVKLPEDGWPGFIAWLDDFEYEKLALPRPDLVIYLDLPIDAALELMAVRYREKPERQRDIHERDKQYLAACQRAAAFAADALGWRRVPCTEAGILRAIGDIAIDVENLVAML